MKSLLKFSIFTIGLFFILSSFIINFFPPTKKELIGTYISSYNGKNYYLDINKSGNTNFIVKNANKIIYRDICRNYEIAQVKYKKLSEYRVVFTECQGMDSSAILERNILFNLQIGNNGSEFKRIDPDSNVFYNKVE